MKRKKKLKQKQQREPRLDKAFTQSEAPPTFIPMAADDVMEEVEVETITGEETPGEIIEEEPDPQVDDPSFQVLERDALLSECMLWQLQEDFYCNAGIAAWNQVPFYPTCNAFIGRTYAEMILSFLLDYQQHLKSDEPVYIVEMAAGSGALSFYVAKELRTRKPYYKALDNIQLVYVMTDFTENNVQAWEQNPKLIPLKEEGLIDFAVFRPENQDTIFLRSAKKTLASGQVHNPVIAIANYFFDTIRQDLFRVEDEALYEGRVSFYRKVESEEDRDLPVNLEELIKIESFRPTKRDYYDDPRLNKVLAYYLDNYDKASVIFPINSFKCIQNLQTISNNSVVLISSDKGFTHEQYMYDHWDQNYALHGSFSFMVNYHALGRYFVDEGGTFLATVDKNLCLSTVMGILTPETPCTFDQSRYYFEEKVSKENPINNLYFAQDLLHQVNSEPNRNMFKSCLSFLKLCNNDPIVFYFMGSFFYSIATDLDWHQRESLLKTMGDVKENFYRVRKEFNALYWIAKIYYGLDCFTECMETYQESIDTFGVDDHALYYIAACYEVQGNAMMSLYYYKKTLELDADCPLTKAGLKRMLDKVASEANV